VAANPQTKDPTWATQLGLQVHLYASII